MNPFIFLRTSLLGTLAVLASVSTGTADDTVFFEPLKLAAPAATIAVSEDGAWLFSAHEADDEVLVWNVPTGERAAVIETDSPLARRAAWASCWTCDAANIGPRS